jgi:hypothetical protein
MKDYIAKNLNRSIPVGYSAADIRPILMDTLNYFMCADDANSQSDFFGLNSYSWCGNSSYTKSGYDVLTEDFADASIPVFFSEYGCNEVQPRYFTEVEALYGQEMTQSFSGGLVYEYTQEENDYGLVQINDNSTVTLLVDYDNLMAQYKKLDMSRIQASNTTQTSAKAPKCDSSLITNSTFTDSFDLPKRPSKVQKMIDNGLSDANTGKLVEVKSTDITQKVYNANGQEITGIKLNILASGESNTPGAHSSGSTSGSSGSGSSGSSSSSGSDNKGAAGTISVPFVGLLSAASFMAFFML